jgi:hypothetical protein
VLPNIEFLECDMRLAVPNVPRSVVVAVHGCGEVNEMAIEMALQNKAAVSYGVNVTLSQLLL